MPMRRRDPLSVPRTIMHTPSRVNHDYGIDESITRAGYFSNAILEDTDAAAARSRGKDYDLLRNTQSAIIDTEMHSTPRTAVASRRARASSVPPRVQGRPARLHQQLNNRKVVGSPQGPPTIIYMQTPPVVAPNLNHPSEPVVRREVPWRLRANSVSDHRRSRAGSLPPRPLSYHADVYEPDFAPPALGTENLRAHRRPLVPRPLRATSVQRSGVALRAGSMPPGEIGMYQADVAPILRARPGSASPFRRHSFHPNGVGYVGTEGLRAHRPPAVSRLDRARSVSALNRPPIRYVDDIENEMLSQPTLQAKRDKPGSARKAPFRAVSEPPAFISSSERYPRVPDVPVKSLSRRLYARRGLGPMQLDTPKSAIFHDPTVMSSSLHASRGPLPKPNERKAIRTVDGFTKPSNVMSWEHRVESRLSPDDLIYTPQSFGRMRNQLQNAREKMDKHRQLLDRYLDQDMKPASSIVNNHNKASASGSSIY